jgi:oligopeptide transport system substrate-binding protein
MVSSGAYKLDARVVQGYILASKNPYYYDAKNVAIEQVKFFPIVDSNSALSQYKSGDLDMTYKLPIDQYKTIKAQMPNEEHTVMWETIEYFDFNMTSAKFKDNLDLRKALSIAVDREAMVKDVMGQDQKSLYSYVTPTIEGGKFAGLDYDWAKLPRDRQIAMAQELFKKAGYGPQHPLSISISYNTRDDNKKKSIALAAMWQQVFGADSIKVTSNNQEWKTFLQTRHKGDYDIARIFMQWSTK